MIGDRVDRPFLTTLAPSGRRRALLLAALVVGLPAPAYALGNPFVLYTLAQVVWQLLLVLLLAAPLLWNRVWCRVVTLSPPTRLVLTGSLMLSAALLAERLVPDQATLLHTGPRAAAFADDCEALGPLAKALGLGPDDLLLDLRESNQFRSYHVPGACNLDLRRLLADEALRGRLEEKSSRVWLVAEWVSTVQDGYNDLLALGCDPVTWRVLEAGYGFERLRAGAENPPRIYSRPLTTQDARAARPEVAPLAMGALGSHLRIPADARLPGEGGSAWQSLLYRSGPGYGVGGPLSILGDHPSWRQRAPAYLASDEARDLDVVIVIDGSMAPTQTRVPGLGREALSVGRMGASLRTLDELGGHPVRRAVFACAGSIVDCPAAEGLASQILAGGGEVTGYVVPSNLYEPDLVTQLSGPWIHAPRGVEWALLALCVFASLLVDRWSRLRLRAFALAGQAVPPGKNPGRGWCRRRSLVPELILRSAAACTGMALVLGLAVLVSRIAKAQTGFGAIMLIDLGRSGYPAVGGGVALGYALLIASWMRHRPAMGRPLLTVAYVTVATLSTFMLTVGAAFMAHPTVFDLSAALLILGAPFGLDLLRRASWSLGLMAGRRDVTLVPLEAMRSSPSGGQKVRWLARAVGCALQVPDAVILVTSQRRLEEALANDAVRRRIETRLRRWARTWAGRVVVRSAAPGEDATGESQAGRYRSVFVSPEDDMMEAVVAVVESYRANGVARDTEISVIVQAQVRARLAGVATRESAGRGRAILVEAAAGDNLSVTGGRGAETWGRIGARSRRWISGDLRESGLSSTLVHRVFDALEQHFACDISVEWAWTGRSFELLQVRGAIPGGIAPTPAQEDAVGLLDAWAPLLSRAAPGRKDVILDGTVFADFQYGAALATREIFLDAYASGLRDYRWQRISFADPPVVVIGGQLYLNKVVQRPVVHALFTPLLKLRALSCRLRLGRRLDRVEGRLRDAETWLISFLEAQDPARDGPVEERARRVLDLRAGLLRHAIPPQLALGFLQRACYSGDQGANPKAAQVDAVFRALGKGESLASISRSHPYRSLQDYALDRPRVAERVAEEEGGALQPRDLRDRFVDAFQARVAESAAGDETAPLDVLARLQAKARDLHSFWTAHLRVAFLELSEQLYPDQGLQAKERLSVFELSTEQLREISRGDDVASLPSPSSPMTPGGEQSRPASSPTLGLTLTLAGLERCAAGDGVDPGSLPTSAYWVCGGGDFLGEVVSSPTSPVSAAGHRPVLVFERATLAELLPAVGHNPGALVVVLGGNRLCHAAIILAEMRVDALFGAAEYADLLRLGARLRFGADGVVAAS